MLKFERSWISFITRLRNMYP